MDFLDWVRGPLLAASLAVFLLGTAWRLWVLYRLPRARVAGAARQPFGRTAALRAALGRFAVPRGFAPSATLVTLNPYAFHIGLADVGREVTAGRLKLERLPPGQRVTYHDACKLARHGGVVQEPRAALRAIGVDLRETEPTAEQNWCCGGGAGTFLINRAAPLRHKAWAIKRDQIDATGADTVVVSCGSCRLNLMAGAEADAWPVQIRSLVEMAAAQLPA